MNNNFQVKRAILLDAAPNSTGHINLRMGISQFQGPFLPTKVE